MSEQNDVLKEVVKKLEEADFPYMVSGSVASSYYAQPRMTRDIDIVIELNLHNTDALIRAFSEDYYIDDVAARDAIAQTSMFNIIHLASMIKIDFIVRKHSPYRETEFLNYFPSSMPSGAYPSLLCIVDTSSLNLDFKRP